MSDFSKYDAIIVGAGHAGLTMATALAKLDFKVAVIAPKIVTEKVADIGDGRALAISNANQKMLALLGIWQRLGDKYCDMNAIHILDGHPGDILKEALLKFDLDDGSIEASNNYIVESGHLLGAMWDETAEQTNIDILKERKLAEFKQEDQFVFVDLDNGDKLRGNLLIAADGRGSIVRSKLGITDFGWSYDQNAIVCPVTHEKPHNYAAYQTFYPNGSFASLPLPDDADGNHRSSIVWADKTDQAKTMMVADDASFNKALEDRFGLHLGAVKLSGTKFTYPLNVKLSYDYFKGRAVLIGDAAHGIHPIAGQGLNLGLRDIAALAEVMINARSLGLDFASHTVLNNYQSWRRFDSMSHAAFADVMHKLFSNDIAPLRFIRDAGLRIVDELPTVKQYFQKEAAAKSGNLPKMMLGQWPE